VDARRSRQNNAMQSTRKTGHHPGSPCVHRCGLSPTRRSTPRNPNRPCRRQSRGRLRILKAILMRYIEELNPDRADVGGT
jgi:hypothetical protein